MLASDENRWQLLPWRTFSTDTLTVTKMRSPILSQFNNIASSPYRVSPERIDELREIDIQESFELNILEGSGFRFGVSSNNSINTNIATLEYLWSSSYAHLILYDQYIKCHNAGNKYFDTGQPGIIQSAVDLFKWGTINLNSTGNLSWPSGYPKPKMNMEQYSWENITNELFLCSVAWIIHHEVSHVRLKHSALETTNCIQEEKEADIAATLWITEQCNEEELTKRTLGMVSAILSLQAFEDLKKHEQTRTHPKAFERIYYCLSHTNLDENHILYAFTSVIMQIYLAFCGINVAHDGETFRDMFSEYIYEYAKNS